MYYVYYLEDLNISYTHTRIYYMRILIKVSNKLFTYSRMIHGRRSVTSTLSFMLFVLQNRESNDLPLSVFLC